jgi:uncharacterized protein involved in response to NO
LTTSAEQIRACPGPALFSYGFRVFFLVGAVCSTLSTSCGEAPAVVTGFLQTAVSNWKGHLPVVSAPPMEPQILQVQESRSDSVVTALKTYWLGVR